jgi:AraC family transcriptional regulator
MGYEITVEKLAPQPALVIAAEVAADSIGAALAEMLPEVFQFALASGAGVAGYPFTRYVGFGPGILHVEAGVPVSKKVTGTDRIKVIELPDGPAATTVHRGPYDKLRAGHEALRGWLRAQGKSAADAPWEVYVTDPGEEPDPAQWETKIYQPFL